ncbi:MAG: hypothetical protein PVF58_01020 [Candidatus Methanofastidiosia archaeon]|jgi:hypothetical protein
MGIASWTATPTADGIIEEIEKTGSYTLKPRKIVALIHVIIYSIFVYLGIKEIQEGHYIALGYFLAIFFGAGMVGELCDFFGLLYFRITSKGFTIRLLRGSYFYTWENVKYFRTDIPRWTQGKWALFGYIDPKKEPLWTLEETNIREGVIPNPYNMSSQTLIELLTKLQTHFLDLNSKE